MRDNYKVFVGGDYAFTFDAPSRDAMDFDEDRGVEYYLIEAINSADLGVWRLTPVDHDDPGVHTVYHGERLVGRWSVEIEGDQS
jgi:hypothetical protein